ncbi:MAG TPA: hypothetical protein VF998_06900, partial [Candidatus Limnocylindria bacterium]
ALGMGESAEVQLIGPGMPPDHQTRSTAYRIERIADEGGLRRYRFAARRRNASYGGVLSADIDGRLAEIEFAHRNPQVSNVTETGRRPEAPSVYVRRAGRPVHDLAAGETTASRR